MSQGYIIVDQALVYDAADGADVANASGGCLYTAIMMLYYTDRKPFCLYLW